MHCTKKSANCTTGGSELCGHGICVPDNSKAGYTCICDQVGVNLNTFEFFSNLMCIRVTLRVPPVRLVQKM